MTDPLPYDRDLIGYAGKPPHARWPGGARIAVQFVLNYEEGGENCILHGDAGAETFLSEMADPPALIGERHMSMESLYEYGSRAGLWRILGLFRSRGVPLTIFAVAAAMERNPLAVETFLKDGHEICSHGLRWINYQHVDEATERAHMAEAIEIIRKMTGERPLGWYTGRTSPNTRRLVADEGGFLYDADDYSDDLPFWSTLVDTPHLIVPYTLDTNDMRFHSPQGFSTGEDFTDHLKAAFDVLYAEGAETPKMLSVGLHCRVVGKPSRFAALERFVDYAAGHADVWFARRIEIARHWREVHPYPGAPA